MSSDQHVRVQSELYTSPAFIQEHDKVQCLPLHPDDQGCTRERVVAGLMFWSDSTHLASFGTAKLWPIYLMFANLSKYIRAMPKSGACHHLAYIPSVSLELGFLYSLFYSDCKPQSYMMNSMTLLLNFIQSGKLRRAIF
jgi:hypothetical protein